MTEDVVRLIHMKLNLCEAAYSVLQVGKPTGVLSPLISQLLRIKLPIAY